MSVLEEVNHSSSTHWGQLDEDNFDLTLPLTESTANDKRYFDIPSLYQPSSLHRAGKKDEAEDISSLKAPLDSRDQNFIFQSIELQHFNRRMRYMLSAAHLHQNELQKGTNFDNPVLPSPPVPPKRFCSSEGRLLSHTQPSFMSEEFSSENNKQSLDNKIHCPIELDSILLRQLMYKAVGAATAHSGFEFATETSISTLTDVTAHFTQKLCKALKAHFEYQPAGENVIDGFSHVLKRYTSDDIGSLQEHWISHVKQVALKLEKEGLSLLEEYNALKESSVKQVVVKQEKNVNIPSQELPT